MLLVIDRSVNTTSAKARPDFIRQAADSNHGPEVVVGSSSSDLALHDSEYVYEVVGESYQRDLLTALIRAHNAFETGQILSTAVLEMEPSNPFDSPAVTEIIKKSGKKVYEVPVRIGWDTNSPSPLIGVRLALTLP